MGQVFIGFVAIQLVFVQVIWGLAPASNLISKDLEKFWDGKVSSHGQTQGVGMGSRQPLSVVDAYAKGSENYWLSNFYTPSDGSTLFQVKMIWGKEEILCLWKSAEHYYNAMKFWGINRKAFDAVRKASTPKEALKLGQKYRLNPEQIKDWDAGLKFQRMREALWYKFSVSKYKAKLMSLNGNVIVESSDTDSTWGFCPQVYASNNRDLNDSSNYLGRLQMELIDFWSKNPEGSLREYCRFKSNMRGYAEEAKAFYEQKIKPHLKAYFEKYSKEDIHQKSGLLESFLAERSVLPFVSEAEQRAVVKSDPFVQPSLVCKKLVQAFQKLFSGNKTVDQSFHGITSKKMKIGRRNSLNEIYNPQTGELINGFNMERHDFIWSFYPKVSRGISGASEPTYLSYDMKVGRDPYNILTYPLATREALFDGILQLRRDQNFRAKLKQNDDVYLRHIGLAYDEGKKSLKIINELDFKEYIREPYQTKTVRKNGVLKEYKFHRHNRLRLSRRYESLVLFGEVERAMAMKDLLQNETVTEVQEDYWQKTFENSLKVHKVLEQRKETLGSASMHVGDDSALEQIPKVDTKGGRCFVWHKGSLYIRFFDIDDKSDFLKQSVNFQPTLFQEVVGKNTLVRMKSSKGPKARDEDRLGAYVARRGDVGINFFSNAERNAFLKYVLYVDTDTLNKHHDLRNPYVFNKTGMEKALYFPQKSVDELKTIHQGFVVLRSEDPVVSRSEDPVVSRSEFFQLDPKEFVFSRNKPGGVMPGAIYHDVKTGEEWMVKMAGNPSGFSPTYRYRDAMKEVMLLHVLRKMGVVVPEARMVRATNGSLLVGTKIVPHVKLYESLSEEERLKIAQDELHRMYIYAVLFANEDFFSPSNQNVIFQSNGSGGFNPFQLDLGESFKGDFRAIEKDIRVALSNNQFFRRGGDDGFKDLILKDLTDTRLRGLLEEAASKAQAFVKNSTKFLADFELIPGVVSPEPEKYFDLDDLFQDKTRSVEVSLKYTHNGESELRFNTVEECQEFYNKYVQTASFACGVAPYPFPSNHNIFVMPKDNDKILMLKKTDKAGDAGCYKSGYKTGWIGINFKTKQERRVFEHLLSIDQLKNRNVVEHLHILKNETTFYVEPQVLKGKGGLKWKAKRFKFANQVDIHEYDAQLYQFLLEEFIDELRIGQTVLEKEAKKLENQAVVAEVVARGKPEAKPRRGDPGKYQERKQSKDLLIIEVVLPNNTGVLTLQIGRNATYEDFEDLFEDLSLEGDWDEQNFQDKIHSLNGLRLDNDKDYAETLLYEAA